MKEQIEVKGFRFQVYCDEGWVHVHSPEETAKVKLYVWEARKKMKELLKRLNEKRPAQFGDLKILWVSDDTVRLELGNEKREVDAEEFQEKMEDFRKLVERD